MQFLNQTPPTPYTHISTIAQTHSTNTKISVVRAPDNSVCIRKSIRRHTLNPKQMQHIRNEKEALEHFSYHPNINHLVETEKDEGHLHLMLSPVEGLPLHKLLKMTGHLNEAFVRVVAVQVALLLRDVHHEGYVYRDVKASNFIVDCKGRLRMVDLGLAKRIGCDRTYTVCGTPHAMPPKLQQGYSYEYDYYSYGVLLYELIKGVPPYGYQVKNTHAGWEGVPAISRDLIEQLMKGDNERLGRKGGWDQIMLHQYFNFEEFLVIKDLYQGAGVLDQQDQRYKDVLQEIYDFGFQVQKYDQILPNDPFYKFTH